MATTAKFELGIVTDGKGAPCLDQAVIFAGSVEVALSGEGASDLAKAIVTTMNGRGTFERPRTVPAPPAPTAIQKGGLPHFGIDRSGGVS